MPNLIASEEVTPTPTADDLANDWLAHAVLRGQLSLCVPASRVPLPDLDDLGFGELAHGVHLPGARLVAGTALGHHVGYVLGPGPWHQVTTLDARRVVARVPDVHVSGQGNSVSQLDDKPVGQPVPTTAEVHTAIALGIEPASPDQTVTLRFGSVEQCFEVHNFQTTGEVMKCRI